MEQIERTLPLQAMVHLLGSLLVATATLSGCSDEASGNDGNHPKEGYSHVQLAIGTSNLDMGTRATWNDLHATDNEMMKCAYVVMTKEGKVENIYKVEPSSGTESEREMVAYITTQNGTYTFYNFANLEPETTTENEGDGTVTSVTFNGLTFTVGNSVPMGTESATTNTAFNNYVIPSTGIPMTNIESHEVSNDVTIDLQLYRQLSKMRFQFTNNTTSAVKVEKVTLRSLTKDNTPIYYFPRKDDNENVLVEWPDAAAHDTTAVVYYDCGDNPQEIGTDDDNKTVTLPDTYFNESQSSHTTGRYPLTIQMKRLSSDGTTWTEDVRHALINRTGASNNDLPRNSYVIVPIALTDYVFDLEAFFYPPIGGYPPFSMTKHNEEYYATFVGSGDFQLIPHIYKYADRDDPTQWFMLNDVSKVESYSEPDVNDPSGIFSTPPHVDSTTGEILGTLSGNTGRASMKITIYIKVNDTQTQVYNRTVYFIAQSE